MKTPPPIDDAEHWTNCSPGELARHAASIDAHHRLRRGKQLIGRAVGGMTLIAASLLVVGAFTRDATALATLTCTECREHFAEYHGYQTAQLQMNNQLAERMKAHLAHCEHCRAKFLAAFPDAKMSEAFSAVVRRMMFADAEFLPRNARPVLAGIILTPRSPASLDLIPLGRLQKLRLLLRSREQIKQPAAPRRLIG